MIKQRKGSSWNLTTISSLRENLIESFDTLWSFLQSKITRNDKKQLLLLFVKLSNLCHLTRKNNELEFSWKISLKS